MAAVSSLPGVIELLSRMRLATGDQVSAFEMMPRFGIEISVKHIPGVRDPFDQPYYWLAGKFVNLDQGEETDIGAIDDGFISITPIHYDLTAYEFLKQMESWTWDQDRPSGASSQSS